MNVVVAGVGSGGTITGISRYLKQTCGKSIISVAVEAKRVRKHLIEPLGHLLIKDVKAHEHVRPLFQRLEDTGKLTTLKKIAEKTVCIFNFAIALGKCENNPAYAIWKGLSFSRPSKNNSFPSITDSEIVCLLMIKNILF